MKPEEPRGDLGGEAGHWSAYLDFYRAEVAAAVTGLPVEEQRTSRGPSGWTPVELLCHLLHMERRWFVWGFLGEQVERPWGDWTVDEPWDHDEGDPAVRWQVPDDVSAEALVGRLEEVGARTRTVLRDFPMEALASPGGRFADDRPTLRWICQHVVHEYARHAGHLDIVVELAGS